MTSCKVSLVLHNLVPEAKGTNHPGYEWINLSVRTPGRQSPAEQMLCQRSELMTSRLAEELSPMLLNAVIVKVVVTTIWTQELPA